MADRILRGVNCPACGGSLEIKEGACSTNCKFCGTPLRVKGDRGISKYYVPIKYSGEQNVEKARTWMGGFDKASGLAKEAKFVEVFPVFVPFWRVNTMAVGWVLGDVKKKSGKTTTYVPVEKRICKRYEYTSPACEIGEFGVDWVDLTGDEILPFDLEAMQEHGMTFEVLATPTAVIDAAREKFEGWADSLAGVDRVTFRKLHLLNVRHSIVYYPLWILRYEYRERVYQITADAESSELLYGRAPGNNVFRVACLLGSIMAGNFALTSYLRSGDYGDDIVGVIVFCVVIMLAGFWKFRYGGEVKIERHKQKSKKSYLSMLPDSTPQEVKSLMEKIGT